MMTKRRASETAVRKTQATDYLKALLQATETNAILEALARAVWHDDHKAECPPERIPTEAELTLVIRDGQVFDVMPDPIETTVLIDGQPTPGQCIAWTASPLQVTFPREGHRIRELLEAHKREDGLTPTAAVVMKGDFRTVNALADAAPEFFKIEGERNQLDAVVEVTRDSRRGLP